MTRRNRVTKGFRLHIGIFGRRNVGKSSLLNRITRQSVSIVSDAAGTTTDPVEKPMEILPLGPVLFIDTAGIDDTGALGALRVEKTRRTLRRTDVGVIVTDNGTLGAFEKELLRAFKHLDIPPVIVFNKWDRSRPEDETIAELRREQIPWVGSDATTGEGILAFKQALLEVAPAAFLESPQIVSDLITHQQVVILVVPIDKEAPKGRLILPQVQTIRDLLDGNAVTVVVKQDALQTALDNLKHPPKLVVTDSQAFAEVADMTPDNVLLTSFSILFARLRGDLPLQTQGARAIDTLRRGDRVLVAEACSHHPIGEDIGRVKIPNWINEHVGGGVHFETVQGHDFPDDLSGYGLVIHCGACMFNRKAVLSRILLCKEQGVPITNYGLVIAHKMGILDRAIAPFVATEAR
ncbi:MAG: [FeFe] hydrogenase H-cluster maturation GTPase HydF [Myxococcota bacterium]|nr:[FeFe] hydrogenase H-cluster maturation GTPase HydF [Myxococcota bacterium]